MPKRFLKSSPPVVDPLGVDTNIAPRTVPKGSDAAREAAQEVTGGDPIIDFKGKSNPYIDYESIDILLSLQHNRSEGGDEMCFIIMGQIKELIFKLLYYELYNARACVQTNDLASTRDMLQRVKRGLVFLTQTWEVLSTISPSGFSEFRDYLGTASGQQSFMYRHVEFILGNKSINLARAHRNVPHVYPALKDNLESPSLYDEIIALLSRRGFDIDAKCMDRQWTDPYRINASVEKAWLDVYQDPSPTNDLYCLAEDLVEIADRFANYRQRHFVSVQRIIGFKPGTGGSAGVGWLKAITEHRFFPEIWLIRTDL